MCTIMTLNIDLYWDNKEAILKQIEKDFMGNCHGSSLILEYEGEVTLHIQTMNIDPIILLLETERWTRMWLHQRYATSYQVGVSTCHGFYTKDKNYAIMHNGIISTANKEYSVDSEAVISLIDSIGVAESLRYFSVSVKNSYSNIFVIDMIDPTQYYIARNNSGSLHHDGKGNYSSIAIAGAIEIPVPIGTFKHYGNKLKKKLGTKLPGSSPVSYEEMLKEY